MQRLFVKVERLRRLHESSLLDVPCERGPDGTFGLGLTDDNVRLQHTLCAFPQESPTSLTGHLEHPVP